MCVASIKLCNHVERHRSTRPALLAWSQQLWHINAVFRLSTSRAYWPALLGNGHCRPSLKRREEGIPERNPPNHAELQSNHLYHNKGFLVRSREALSCLAGPSNLSFATISAAAGIQAAAQLSKSKVLLTRHTPKKQVSLSVTC